MSVPPEALAAWLSTPERATAARFGQGHIHETWRVDPAPGEGVPRLLLQRVNDRVFRDPEGVTHNVQRVTAHLAAKVAARGEPDARRRVLSLVPTLPGAATARDASGATWRAYRFVDGTVTHALVDDPRIAYEAARAFGSFQRDLADLPPPRLPETIPHFHDTPLRFAAFRAAVERDVQGRAREASPEIEAALARERIAGVLLEAHAAGLVPERVTHNDTKIDNVLFDERTGEALCVIDLDTVMPGLGPYDFGDMVRTCVSPTAEDERDLARIHARPDLFRALAAGWVAALGPALSSGERDLLAFSGRLITFEIGLRFLTDHLEGDVYFRTHRPGHNLDRCRAQFALLRSLEDQAREFRRIVRTAGAA